ncbi:uncharacterized protein LOC144633771 isoform X2 [Oculina patagonica]
MMRLRVYWQLFLLIGVLSIVSQSSENESSIAPSATSQHTIMTITPSPSSSSSSSSSVSPTQNTRAGDLDNRDVVVTRPREFKGRFTITNIPWKSQYSNVKSPEYNSLKSSLETVLNNALENKISDFIVCVVQWFNKGSVITDFAVFVKGNSELSNEGLQRIMSEISSSGSLANFSLGNIVMESQPTQDPTEGTEAPLMIELWKIISIGGLLIVFILLIFILGLLMRNRLLKKALTRERRNTEERQQRLQLQRRQVETREALSIIAASSTDELSTFIHNEHGVQGRRFQSQTFSIGTSRSVERLADLLRNSGQRHNRSRDTLGDYDETQFQPLRSIQAQDTTKENQEIKDAHLNNKNKKGELHPGSVLTSSTSNRSTLEESLNPPVPKDDIMPRNDVHSKPKVSFTEPSHENKMLPARAEKQKDQLPKDKQDEEISSRDQPENQVNETKNKAMILPKVQAFEKGADTNDEEQAQDKRRQETRKEPKKLKHISFHNPSSPKPDTLAEREKREEEIRPLGGVRFTVNPFRQPSVEQKGDEQ